MDSLHTYTVSLFFHPQHPSGWHVAHYVICPLDQSTGSAHFFPALENKKGARRAASPGITPCRGPIAIRKEAFFMGATLGRLPLAPDPGLA